MLCTLRKMSEIKSVEVRSHEYGRIRRRAKKVMLMVVGEVG